MVGQLEVDAKAETQCLLVSRLPFFSLTERLRGIEQPVCEWADHPATTGQPWQNWAIPKPLLTAETRKGREAPLLETSRYGRMVSSRSLAAAYRPGGRGYACGQTAGILPNAAAVLGVVLSLPDCGWRQLPHFRSAESGGPRSASPRFPRDQDSFADLIPAATRVSPQLCEM